MALLAAAVPTFLLVDTRGRALLPLSFTLITKQSFLVRARIPPSIQQIKNNRGALFPAFFNNLCRTAIVQRNVASRYAVQKGPPVITFRVNSNIHKGAIYDTT